MGKLFGTDGIRGVVGETLTAELAYRVGQAITIVLTEQKGGAPIISIGKDTRISSDMLESALMAGICSMGGSVMPFGTIPTPAVAFLTVQEEADAGIVISASHNPYEHNGIKIFGGQGYKLSDEMEEKVENIVLSGETLPVKTHDQIGMRLHGMRQMKSDYISHLLSTVDCDMRGLRVLVDCANGAASATAPDRSLGRGSGTITSKAAPARCPPFRASIRASWSMALPRPTFTTYAPSGSRAMRSRERMWWVSGVPGRAITRISVLGRTLSSSAKVYIAS